MTALIVCNSVLSFVKNDGARALKHLVFYFHLGDTKLICDLLSNLCAQIMKCRQTVHEDGLRTCQLHEFRCHLIRRQRLDALCPNLIRLSHGDPNIRIQNVRARHGCLRVIREGQRRAALLGHVLTIGDQIRVREIFLIGAGHEVHPHLRTGNHHANCAIL